MSIVIPTKDSACTLEACLSSITAQDYRNHEIIIVDCFSRDGTIAIAERFGAKIIQSSSGRSEARNLGFSVSQGPILLSIDSDMLLEPSVLGEIASSMHGDGGLIIPEVGHGADFLSRCKDLEKRCYLGDPLVESVRAFTRDAFMAVGGYDPALIFGEDWDIHNRIISSFSIGRISSRMMHDTSNASLFSQFRKAYLYGRTFPAYLAKGQPQARAMLDPKRIFFIRNFHKLKKEPLNAIGLFFIKGFEYAFGLVGFLSAKLGL